MSMWFEVQKRFIELTRNKNEKFANVLYAFRDKELCQTGIRSRVSTISKLDETKKLVEDQPDFYSWDITLSKREYNQLGFINLVREPNSEYIDVWVNGKFSGVRIARKIIDLYRNYGYDAFSDSILEIYKDERVSNFIRFEVFRKEVFTWFGLGIKEIREYEDSIKNLSKFTSGQIQSELRSYGTTLESYEVRLGEGDPRIIYRLYGQPEQLGYWEERDIVDTNVHVNVNLRVDLKLPSKELADVEDFEKTFSRYINYLLDEQNDNIQKFSCVSSKLISTKSL